MNLRIIPIALFLILGLTACSSYHISYDYDPGVSFQKYSTYDWNARKQRERGRDGFAEQRVKAAMEKELAARGFRLESSADPDFFIEVYVLYRNRNYRTSYTTHLGGWRYGTAMSTSSVRRIREGTIVLDVLDGRSKKLVWQGVAEGAIQSQNHPEEAQAEIGQAVQELLKNFPPQSR